MSGVSLQVYYEDFKTVLVTLLQEVGPETLAGAQRSPGIWTGESPCQTCVSSGHFSANTFFYHPSLRALLCSASVPAHKISSPSWISTCGKRASVYLQTAIVYLVRCMTWLSALPFKVLFNVGIIVQKWTHNHFTVTLQNFQ